MGLTLGKSFDRSYNIRLPFLEGYYNIGVYFNKRSSFLLFRVDPDFTNKRNIDQSLKISMFKNLESSRFCETFLNLHSYRKSTLDISNQFQSVKDEYHHDISFVLNETMNLSKVEVDDRVLYDTLTIYGLTLTAYSSEFLFLVAERQNIIKRLNKKIVRTTGCQISTSAAIDLLNEFHQESLVSGREGTRSPISSGKTIRLADVDEEQRDDRR